MPFLSTSAAFFALVLKVDTPPADVLAYSVSTLEASIAVIVPLPSTSPTVYAFSGSSPLFPCVSIIGLMLNSADAAYGTVELRQIAAVITDAANFFVFI